MSSGDIMLNEILSAPLFANPRALREYGVNMSKSVPGIVAEFGVFEGNTLRELVSWTDRSVIGFDSFAGLPAAWNGFSQYHFATQLPYVEGATILAGLFSETLPSFSMNNHNLFSFVHIDCDLYMSTKDIFTLAKNLFQKGTVIVFDEFYNYPTYRDHEMKAFSEFIEITGYRYRVIGRTDHQQVGIILE